MNNFMELKFKAAGENEALARNAAAAFVLYLDPDCEELAEIKTAVSEAVTNSIIHGYEGREDGEVILRCEIKKSRELYITVTDTGRGIEDIEMAKTPLFTTGNTEERSGMGFTVMESFMDSLKVESEPSKGTTVIMVKHLGAGFE